ncbi:MAG: Hsp20/alpha crystallin family protein [Thermodesulfobacteriota bacterium]|jgi:HSP20 family molecular chaperone IbpA
MAEKTSTTPSGARAVGVREGTRAQEYHIPPVVDIYETPDSLVLLADMPGVSKEDLDVRIDNNVLTLRGKARHIAPGEAIYREFELMNFFRQFELSEEVNQEKITAQLKHGVLTLRLPKVEKAEPRQIEVQVE